MMTLQILLSLMVSRIEKIHDYIQIVFSDGTTLTIFNSYDYDGDSVHSAEEKKVISVEELEEKIVVQFEDGSCVAVGMKDDDYNGPEAMILRREGESPVVWS